MTNQDECRRILRRVLRTARKEAKLTQVDVAERLYQPQSYVSKYEAGGRRLDLIELFSVCAALEIQFETLLETWRKEIGE